MCLINGQNTLNRWAPVKLTINTPPDFHFLSAVCSHGFFVLAPNQWHPPTHTLTTAISLDDQTAALVTIRARGTGRITITTPQALPPARAATVRQAVRRMLRLDEDFSRFHLQCRSSSTHADAVSIGFGRLIRGATLFEDIVKVICTCNVTWRQTTSMIKAMVSSWGTPVLPAAEESSPDTSSSRAFPRPAQLARVRASTLKKRARVGYRAEFIQRLARDVTDGRLNLAELEQFDGPSAELHKRLKTIHGIGDYGAGNLCMLLGRYDRLAIDTEMARLFRHRYPGRQWTPARMKAHYDAWAPYQFLAYWFELWKDYVERHGQADQWWPDAAGSQITRAPESGQ